MFHHSRLSKNQKELERGQHPECSRHYWALVQSNCSRHYWNPIIQFQQFLILNIHLYLIFTSIYLPSSVQPPMIRVWLPNDTDPGPARRLWRVPYWDHSLFWNRAIRSDFLDPSQPPIINAESGVDAVAYRTIRLNNILRIYQENPKELCKKI